MKNYSDSDYLDANFFGTDLQYVTTKIVITRKEHMCALSYREPHQIPKGSRAKFMKVIMDGEWGKCWCCTKCMDKELKRLGI